MSRSKAGEPTAGAAVESPRQRVVVLIGLATLLVVAIAAAWQTAAPDSGGPEDAATHADRSSERRSAPDAETPVRSDSARPVRTAASRSASIAPTKLRLRVVDHRDDTPLPGATVWCVDDDDRENTFTRPRHDEHDHFGDVYHHVRRHGRAFVADQAREVERRAPSTTRWWPGSATT